MNFNELLPLANADDIRRLDRLSCERQGINALQLMERAATRCTAKLLELYPDNHHWTIVAGAGNNGGDGLVIARQLFMRGDRVQVYRPQHRHCSADHEANAARLERLLPTADLAAFTPPTRGVLPSLASAPTARWTSPTPASSPPSTAPPSPSSPLTCPPACKPTVRTPRNTPPSTPRTPSASAAPKRRCFGQNTKNTLAHCTCCR